MFLINQGAHNMMLNKLVSLLGAVLLTGSVYASQEQSCPNINDIKAEGVSMAEEIMANLFLSYNISNYNTQSTWGFVMAPIDANSNEEAIEISNKVLEGMSSPGIPEESDGNDFVCLYNTGRQDMVAAAINADHMISPSKLKHYIQKHLKR